MRTFAREEAGDAVPRGLRLFGVALAPVADAVLCGITRLEGEGWSADGQRGYAHSRSRNQKVHRFGARLLFRRLPGPRRTFVVDDARRAVAAVVRALDERDHRIYAQEG